jgi:hypothetical protein
MLHPYVADVGVLCMLLDTLLYGAEPRHSKAMMELLMVPRRPTQVLLPGALQLLLPLQPRPFSAKRRVLLSSWRLQAKRWQLLKVLPQLLQPLLQRLGPATQQRLQAVPMAPEGNASAL